MVLVPGMLPTTSPTVPGQGNAAQPGQPTSTNPTGTPLPGVAGPTTQTSAGTVPGGGSQPTPAGYAAPTLQGYTGGGDLGPAILGASSGTGTPPPSLFAQANTGGTTDSGYTATNPASGVVPSVATSASAAPTAESLSGTPLQAVSGSPGGNLVGSQINPTESAATQQYGTEEANAVGNVANNQPDLQNLNNAAFQSWVNESNPVYQQALRSASDQAAATGSLGSGQLETGIGSLADTFAQQAMAAQTSGALNAAQQDFTNANTAAGTTEGAQNTSFGQDVSNTNQLDQQQQNQNALQQQAVTNNANQEQEQQNIDNSQVANADTEASLGYAQNPAQFEANLGNEYGSEAAGTAAGVGNLMSNYSYQQALNGTPGANNGTAGSVPIPASANAPVGTVTNDPYTTGQNSPLPPYVNPNQFLPAGASYSDDSTDAF